MSTQFVLNPIEAKTKGDVRKLRRSGFIPVSVQHKGMPTQHFVLEAKPLEEFIRRHGEASFVDLVTSVDNVHQRAIVREIQREPISQSLLQVTFQQVRREDRVKTHVPLRFIGEPEEVRLGAAIAQHALDNLEIDCDPEHLPDHIDVDISQLMPNHPLRIADLPAHPHYKILASPDTTLVSLTNTQKGRDASDPVEEPAAVA